MGLSDKAIKHYRGLLSEAQPWERPELVRSIEIAHAEPRRDLLDRKSLWGATKERYDLETEKINRRGPGEVAIGRIGDVGLAAAKGVIGWGESAVGLADIPTFGHAGKALESVGYDPKSAKRTIDSFLSPEQKIANERVQNADGFWNTVKESVKNPSTIAMAATESLPSMLGGGAIAQGLVKGSLRVAPHIAGAIGEGLVSAGQSAEQTRQESENGLLSLKQLGMNIASGVGTGALGYAGGKLAKRLGFADVDTMVASAGIDKTEAGIIKSIVGGGISEGVFEELPQSVQEQIWANAALDKPLLEGVPESAAQGMLVGGVMGGGANVLSAVSGKEKKETLPTPQEQIAEIRQMGAVTPEEWLTAKESKGVGFVASTILEKAEVLVPDPSIHAVLSDPAAGVLQRTAAMNEVKRALEGIDANLAKTWVSHAQEAIYNDEPISTGGEAVMPTIEPEPTPIEKKINQAVESVGEKFGIPKEPEQQEIFSDQKPIKDKPLSESQIVEQKGLQREVDEANRLEEQLYPKDSKQRKAEHQVNASPEFSRTDKIPQYIDGKPAHEVKAVEMAKKRREREYQEELAEYHGYIESLPKSVRATVEDLIEDAPKNPRSGIGFLKQEIDRRLSVEAPKTEAQETPEGLGETKKGRTYKGKSGSTYTQKNDKIDFEYAVVGADDLVVSHDSEYHKNEAYPQELQPRDRDRAGLRLQVEKIANTINPARLGSSPGVSSGAPIIGEDLVVESGNGRSIAIRKAYDLKKADSYKKFIIDNAEDFGLSKEEAKKIKRPVLVRIRKTNIDRATFAKEANRDEIARMSPLEQAVADSEMISDDEMSIFKPSDDGSISPYANQAFIKRFLSNLGDNEAAGIMTEDGRFTKTGIDRLQAAVFAKAYADKNIISLQAEESNPEVKNILNALNIAAGEFAKARVAGEGFGALDITGDVVEAAKIIRRSRVEGVPVQQIIDQAEMFSKRSIESEVIAQFFDENIRSGKRMGSALKKMAELIKTDLQNRDQLGIFGDKVNLTKKEAIEKGIEHANRENAGGKTQKSLFNSSAQESDNRGEQDRERRAAPENSRGVAEGRINEQPNPYQTILEKPVQLQFDFKPVKRDRKKARHLPGAQRVRMATTGSIAAGSNVVRDVDDAASLLAHIRKEAQENLFIVTTDKDGLVLEIHRYTKGTKGAANINAIEATGHILEIPNAAHVYFAHNHPSRYGRVTDSIYGASPEDQAIASNLKRILQLKNIPLHSFVIEGASFIQFSEFSTHERTKIRPTVRKIKMPVKERRLHLLGGQTSDETQINNTDIAYSLIKKRYGGKDGILFLNTRLNDVGFIPWPKGVEVRDAAAKIIAAANKTNARGAIVSAKRFKGNRRAFLENIGAGLSGNLHIFDVIIDGVSQRNRDTRLFEKIDSRNPLAAEKALDRLDSDQPLYASRTTFANSNLTIKDIQSAFPNQHVGFTNDGNIWVKFRGGGGVVIKNVNEIATDRVAFETSYGRIRKAGEFIAGKYQNSTIELQRDLADKFILAHESYHHLERSGMLTKNDIAALNRAIRRKGIEAPTEEDRAKFVETAMRNRDKHPSVIRRVLQKIADFIDGMVNIFHRTGRGIVRDVESGKAFDRKAKNPKTTIPAYQKTADRWHSQMQKTLEQKLPGKGNPVQLKKTIRSWAAKGQIKAEELEWSGLNEWLDDQTGVVTKQEVLDFLAENNIQLKEVVKSSPAINTKPAEWERKDSGGKETWILGDFYKITKTADGKYAAQGLSDDGSIIWANQEATLDEAKAVVIEARQEDYYNGDIVSDWLHGKDNTKYSQYQTSGGANYKELLLTIPEISQNIKNIDSSSVPTKEKNIAANELYDKDFSQLTKKQQVNTLHSIVFTSRGKYQELGDSLREYEQNKYQSPHWAEPNTLAHVRFNERTDADGLKVLFIEEIQSDWHQEGRRKGYRDGETGVTYGKKLQEKYNESRLDLILSKLATKAEVEKYYSLPNPDRGDTVGVPNAPFRKTWPMLAMKRMVRYAAENGFDSIAWTPGIEQVNRYEDATRQQVDKIVVSPVEAGDRVAFLVLGHKGNQIVFRETVDGEDQLSELIGKEMTRKVMGDMRNPNTKPPTVLKGDDLTIGGEGMKGFYDKILPAAANKFFNKKAWGKGKVSPISLGETKAWSIPVTQEMRSKALYEGMPLFATKQKPAGNQEKRFDKHRDKSAKETLSWLKSKKTPLNWRTDKPNTTVIDRLISTPLHYFGKVPAMWRMFRSGERKMDNQNIMMDHIAGDGNGGFLTKTIHDAQRADKRGYADYQKYRVDQDKNQTGFRVVYNDITEQFDLFEPGEKLIGKYKTHAEAKNAIRIMAAAQKKGKRVFKITFNERRKMWEVSAPKKTRVASFDTEAAAWSDSVTREVKLFSEKYPRASKAVLAALEADKTILHRAFDVRTLELRKIIAWHEEHKVPMPSTVETINGEQIRVSLKTALANMGDLRGHYFPRARNSGRHMLKATKKGAAPFMQFYDAGIENKKGSTVKALLNSMTPIGIQARKLTKAGYTVEIEPSGSLPEDVFEMAGGVVAMNEKINKALSQMDAKDTSTVSEMVNSEAMSMLVKSFVEQVSDIEKSRGFRSHMIKRNISKGDDVWTGYEEDPARAISSYVAGLAGGEAKKQMAMELVKYSTGTDISWDEYQAIKEYEGSYGSYIKSRPKDPYAILSNPDISEEDFNEINDAEAHKKNLANIKLLEKNLESEQDETKIDAARLKLAKAKSWLYDSYQDLVNDRRVDSTEQDNAYHDSKIFMQDMLRNDEATDRMFGMLKGVAVFKYLAFRPAAPVINATALVTAVPGAMNTYGNIPLTTAGKLIGRYCKRYVDFKRKKPVSEEDRWLFSEIERNGWHKAQFNREALTALESKVGKTWNNIIEIGMYGFGVVEQLNRAATISAAYRGLKGLNPKLSRDQLLQKAKEISDKAHSVYHKANRPHIARGSGIGANVVRSAYVFKSFSQNYLLLCKDAWGSSWTPEHVKAFAFLALSPAVLAGGGAIVGKEILTALATALGLGGDDPEEEVYAWANENFGETGERFARNGTFGLAGMNLKGSLAIGITDLPTSLGDLLGAPWSVVSDVGVGAENVARGDYLKGIEKLVPSLAVGNLFKAYRESTEGITTRNNTPVFYGREPLVADTVEAIYRALSFNPARISSIREKQWKERTVEAKYREMRTDIYARYKRYYANPRKTKAERIDLWNDIREYNARIKQWGLRAKGYPPITRRSIRSNMRRAFRPSKRERIRATQ